MIRVSDRQSNLAKLAEQPNLEVLDVGAGRFAVKRAGVATDVEPWHGHYADTGTRFLQTDSLAQFDDDQFDFVWASHILEHVESPTDFLLEIQRVGKAGYIEVPTPLFCNLVVGNEMGHRSHIGWDPQKFELVIAPHRQILSPLLHHSEVNVLYQFFRPQIVHEFYWENSIEFRSEDKIEFPGERFWFDFSENWREMQSGPESLPLNLGEISRQRLRAYSRKIRRGKLCRPIRKIARMLRRFSTSNV